MIQIEFPERHAPARYTVREERDNLMDRMTHMSVGREAPPYEVNTRTIGSVYHRWKGGYEQEITQNGRTHTIGRSPSLIAAINALRRFHELTGYAYAPWEETE